MADSLERKMLLLNRRILGIMQRPRRGGTRRGMVLRSHRIRTLQGRSALLPRLPVLHDPKRVPQLPVSRLVLWELNAYYDHRVLEALPERAYILTLGEDILNSIDEKKKPPVQNRPTRRKKDDAEVASPTHRPKQGPPAEGGNNSSP